MDAVIPGEGRQENLGKMGNNKDIYCYGNWGVNFQGAYQPLPPGTKILVMNQFSYMPDQFLEIKMKKAQNLTLFRVLPSKYIRTYSKKFYMAKCLCL